MCGVGGRGGTRERLHWVGVLFVASEFGGGHNAFGWRMMMATGEDRTCWRCWGVSD